MPFTDRELIKKHLVDFRVGEAKVTNLSVVLAGTGPVQLPHAGLVESSVVVKARESSTPVLEPKALGDEWVALAHSDLVYSSVVVANNTSLGTLYVENIDFTVDYQGGRLKRIASGAISSGQTVAVWYFYYRRYAAGTDYTVNAAAGQVRRSANGAIEDGQAVLIDYTAGFGAVTEDAIDQAITEADQAILQMISPEDSEAADPGLVVAETYWAVSILCRVRAAAELSGPALKTSAAASSARTWLELGDQYQRMAISRLQPFCSAVPALQYPIMARRK